jgi:selT/selW/selH-like putative selenoprotein
MSPPIITVEYCGRWNYEPQFKELKEVILRSVPDAQITGTVGRTRSFEVTINGKLVHSKLATWFGYFPGGGFPDYEKIAEMAKKE